MRPLCQYVDQKPPPVSCVGDVNGPRSQNPISFGLRRSVKSTIDMPPWYQAWAMMLRPGTGIRLPTWLTQFSPSVWATGSL